MELGVKLPFSHTIIMPIPIPSQKAVCCALPALRIQVVSRVFFLIIKLLRNHHIQCIVISIYLQFCLSPMSYLKETFGEFFQAFRTKRFIALSSATCHTWLASFLPFLLMSTILGKLSDHTGRNIEVSFPTDVIGKRKCVKVIPVRDSSLIVRGSVANSYRPDARGYLFQDRATYFQRQVALVAT